MRKINIAFISTLIGVFLASGTSYAIRVPMGLKLEQRNNLRPEFTYYTRDENGNLLKEPCGFPGYWAVEAKVPIEENTNASIQRMVKSFSLSMQVSGREDVKKAKFTVVDKLPKEKVVLAKGIGFYIKASGKFGLEVVLEPSFLKNGISAQRAIFSSVAGEIPEQKDLIAIKNKKLDDKSKRILIINTLSQELNNREFSTLNLTSLALASLLKKYGHDVKVENFDLSGKSIDDIKLQSADIVCISVYDEQVAYIKAFTERIKKVNQKIMIAVGGPALTVIPEHMFAHLPNADIFYRGEAEAGFADVLNNLENLDFESLSELSGVAVHRDAMYYFNDLISVNRMNEEQLNQRPMDFSFLNQGNIDGSFSLMTSLGCPYGCVFCATGGGKAHRAMSPEKVIETARRYQERLETLESEGAKIPDLAWIFCFNDDDFLWDAERAMKILELWRKARLRLKITTFQSTVQSFLTRDETGERMVNIDLIRRISSFRDIFSYGFKIGIGTDALIDSEIGRLKGPNNKKLPYYNEKLIEDVMAELGKRYIPNEHYLILTNADTSLEDLIRTLLKAATFELIYPYTFFHINYAVIPHAGTSVINKLIEDQRESLLNGTTSMYRYTKIPDFKEYDFFGLPYLVAPEKIPQDISTNMDAYFFKYYFYNSFLKYIALGCLEDLSMEVFKNTGLFSSIRSEVVKKELFQFIMLAFEIKGRNEEKVLHIATIWHSLYNMLLLHAPVSESVETSL
ncbi:MAG: cobalamin-dependent protein [Candidatus Omnitrophota bacterium]|nr:cobalamin-dependent protein [Candidatus Omnitrophota bacterium]